MTVSGIHAARVARELYAECSAFLPRKRERAVEAMAFTLRRKEKQHARDFTPEQLTALFHEHGSWSRVAQHLGMKSGNIVTFRRKVGVPDGLEGKKGVRLHNYEVTSPGGAVFVTQSLTAFGKVHGVPPQRLYDVLHGRLPHAGGWAVRKLPSEDAAQRPS